MGKQNAWRKAKTERTSLTLRGHIDCEICALNELFGYKRFRHNYGCCDPQIRAPKRCEKCNLFPWDKDGKILCTVRLAGSIDEPLDNPNINPSLPRQRVHYVWGTMLSTIIEHDRTITFKFDGHEETIKRKAGQVIPVFGKFKIRVREDTKKFLTAGGWGY